MPKSVAFRPAIPADAPSLADLYLVSRRTFLSFAPLAHAERDVRNWIAENLIPSGGVTVAISENNMIGMISVSRDDECGWIDQLYLHPSAVGCGIGSALLDRAKQELGPPIRLYTFQANTGSRRFYERHGFRPVAFGDGHNNEENCPDVLYEWKSN